jgi:hypothetical protein
LVSIGLVLSEEKIFEKVYDVRRRRTPSDGKGPSELKSSSLCLYTSNPFKIVSVNAVLYPRWPPLLKIKISSNGQNCSILSQKVPKFEVFSIFSLAAILVGNQDHRTQFWKGAIQGSFHQGLVAKRRPVSKMAVMTKNRNFFKWPKLLYFKPESAQI